MSKAATAANASRQRPQLRNTPRTPRPTSAIIATTGLLLIRLAAPIGRRAAFLAPARGELPPLSQALALPSSSSALPAVPSAFVHSGTSPGGVLRETGRSSFFGRENRRPSVLSPTSSTTGRKTCLTFRPGIMPSTRRKATASSASSASAKDEEEESAMNEEVLASSSRKKTRRTTAGTRKKAVGPKKKKEQTTEMSDSDDASVSDSEEGTGTAPETKKGATGKKRSTKRGNKGDSDVDENDGENPDSPRSVAGEKEPSKKKAAKTAKKKRSAKKGTEEGEDGGEEGTEQATAKPKKKAKKADHQRQTERDELPKLWDAKDALEKHGSYS
uniref:Uncharacterized protein n=1 Tax=Pseudictyota dubia TaxID=2749911 RepID=A0A7R9ZF00_9STRA|mmetsp:Transcript_4627/g.8035  ORF Transcript_4627/g.8035 Transcript_4627/m.8035 type:complete len:330 (+) Transcript_4627:157-1146(+)